MDSAVIIILGTWYRLFYIENNLIIILFLRIAQSSLSYLAPGIALFYIESKMIITTIVIVIVVMLTSISSHITTQKMRKTITFSQNRSMVCTFSTLLEAAFVVFVLFESR